MTDNFLNFSLVGSGKASIGLCLWDLKRRGLITDRATQVMCPPYMGSWVYASMLPYTTPSISGEKHKILWVYNEFGIAADVEAIMDQINIDDHILVEDNAYNIEVFANTNEKVKSFEYKIQSYSKATPVGMLGGLSYPRSSEEAIMCELNSTPKYLKYFHNMHQVFDEFFFSSRVGSLSHYFREISYATYYRQYHPSTKQRKKLEKFRKQNYSATVENLNIIIEMLVYLGMKQEYFNKDTIVVYLPLISSKNTSRLIEFLKLNNIELVWRQINLTRNLLDQNYSKELLIKLNRFDLLNDTKNLIRILKAILD